MVNIMLADRKEPYRLEDLLEIMRRLRAPDGCPWDREQDHRTIRNNVLEEAYEVADGIDRGDEAVLCEELGDLLLQVVFHAQIAQEADSFCFADVVDGICRKLILRHPHVFGDTVAKTSDAVLDQWDQIKRVEKSQKTYTDTLKSVPAAFPALMRAAKVQKRASKAGFDWPSASGPMGKISEELDELSAALEQDNRERQKEELGDLLFSVVNLSRFLKIDCEEALQAATDKFIGRFEAVEQEADALGWDMSACTLDALDQLWQKAKQK